MSVHMFTKTRNDEQLQRAQWWVSWVKGHTRACTAIAMAIILMELYEDPQRAMAAGGDKLLKSLKSVIIRRAHVAQDLLSIAFENALLSHRGSIRQAHDVSMWLQKLVKLVSTGVTAEEIISRWNKKRPADARLMDNKRMCCLNLLKYAGKDGQQALLDHVSKFGKKSASPMIPSLHGRSCRAANQRKQVINGCGFSVLRMSLSC